MKLRIFLFALIAFPAISQTQYQSSKYNPVWYSSTYEKTHGTYALFDTSSIKAYFTPLGKPEFKMIGPTANTLFYIDSTATFGNNISIKSGFNFRSRDTDSDTLNINAKGFLSTNTAATGPLAFQLKDGATNLFNIDTLGNAGIGTDGQAWHQMSIVSIGGVATGLNITNSVINKNRTTSEQAKDSASVTLQTLSNGNVMVRLRPQDGDSLTIKGDGTTFDFISNNLIRFYGQGGTYAFRIGSANITPSVGDVYSAGASGTAFQKGYFTDSLYVAGKGQTATIKWGTMRQLTDTDSSGVLTMSGPNPAVKMQSGTGLLLTYLGQLAPTYNASAWDFWFSTGGSTGQDTLWISIDGTNAVPWLGGSRVAKH